MFNKGLFEVQNSFSPISSLEMLIIRLIYLKETPNPQELFADLSNSISKMESENSGDNNINSKVKEIMDFFPGAEVENID